MNAPMKHGRLVWIVHGERPDEALVHQVDALREAVVVRVNEEGALLCVTKRPRAGSGCCCQRLLGTRTSDCIRGSSTKSCRRSGIGDWENWDKVGHKVKGWVGEVFLTRLA